MSDTKFQRMVKSLPSLYRAEVSTMIRGLLQAWALGDSEIEAQIKETKGQLFVNDAENRYLDFLGNNVGVPRAVDIGIEDNDFRKLIPVLSYYPKQVRATIIALLDVFWGEGFTRPNINSGNIETFNFGPVSNATGTAIFKDGSTTVKGTGTQFTLEIAKGQYIKANSTDGTTYAKVSEIIDDETLELTQPWTGSFVLNDIINIASILELNYTVDKTITRNIRFRPNAFTDITNVTVKELSDFINSQSEHSQNITASIFLDPLAGNKLNIRSNTAGLTGSIKINGGSANTKLNFDTGLVTETRVSVYEINTNEIVIRIPSSVPVLRRTLKGAAHPKEQKAVNISSKASFDFNSLGANSTLDITVDGNNYTINFDHALNFKDASKATATEVALVINAQISVLEARNKNNSNVNIVELRTISGAAEYQVTGGTANAVLNFDTSLLTDPDIIQTNYPSSYVFDPTGQLFTVTSIASELSQKVEKGSISTTISLADASVFPNRAGKILLNFGRAEQEGPIVYNSRPNNSTLLIDASHIFQNEHLVGKKVNFVDASPTIPRITGDDYPVFVVGTEAARVEAENLIKSLLAAGVVIRFIVEFPEFLFECSINDCCEGLSSVDYSGSLTGQGPLVF